MVSAARHDACRLSWTSRSIVLDAWATGTIAVDDEPPALFAVFRKRSIDCGLDGLLEEADAVFGFGHTAIGVDMECTSDSTQGCLCAVEVRMVRPSVADAWEAEVIAGPRQPSVAQLPQHRAVPPGAVCR